MINAKTSLLMLVLVLLASVEVLHAQEQTFRTEYTDFTEAQAVAQAQGKHVALYLYSGAGAMPDRLSAMLPADWEIQTYLDRSYVGVNVEAESDAGQALVRRYAVLGQVPVLALVSNTGELQGLQVIDEAQAAAGDLAKFFLRTELMAGRFSLSK